MGIYEGLRLTRRRIDLRRRMNKARREKDWKTYNMLEVQLSAEYLKLYKQHRRWKDGGRR